MSYQVYVTAAVTTVGVLGGVYYGYKLYKEHQKHKIPKEWRKIGTLKDLIAYPIKSLAPIFLRSAECSTLGLKDGWIRDRVMMVIDDKNNFITARAYPELLLIEPSVKNSIIKLAYTDMEDVYVNLAEVIAEGKVEEATVWGVTVPVYDCGKEVNKWMTRFLNRAHKSFRLVYYASQQNRELRLGGKNKFFKNKESDTGMLSDEVSYNIINETSVNDLNRRMKDTKVDHHYFRPNFLVTGAEAYDEDNWKFVKIGETVFQVIMPCTRCLMTTIDPETGVYHPKSEPLVTLKSFRQASEKVMRKVMGSSPRMGLQMALRSAPGAIVSLNDPVYVA